MCSRAFLRRSYSPETGELTGDTQALPGQNNYASFRIYAWDDLVRMQRREDFAAVAPYIEAFEYDNGNRLKAAWAGEEPNPALDTPIQSLLNDLSGNILQDQQDQRVRSLVLYAEVFLMHDINDSITLCRI